MRQKFSSLHARALAERLVRAIRRATRKYYSREDQICIVLEGLCSEESLAAQRDSPFQFLLLRAVLTRES